MGNTKIATLKLIPGVDYTIDKTIDVPGDVKLNIQDGDIGELGSRRITHSNTFNIDLNDYNLEALGLNLYNLGGLSLAMSVKVKCRLLDDYYVKDGYLLVNNIDRRGRKISCNFTDSNLEILDKWGLHSYAAYMLIPDSSLPTDHEAARLELLNITINASATMPAVGEGAQQAAIWPTNLNSIGDAFNRDASDVRIPADNLNVFQTRPAFNVKYFLDFMAYGFGFTPVYSTQVDTTRLDNTFIVNEGSNNKNVTPADPLGLAPDSIIEYDDYGQYKNGSAVDFSAEAPSDISAKELLTEVLNQQGLLCHIDEENKEVFYYSYGDYANNYSLGNVQDWSEYFVNKDNVKYDSDFGKQFGRSNIIGLNKPFPGNTFNYAFTEQGDLSRYQPSITNLSKKFNDVTAVLSVNSAGTYPYFEYTHSDICIVELTGTIAAGGLTQYHISSGTNPAALVYKLSNFNYGTLPTALNSWYETVEDGLKVSAEFKLPQKVVDEFNIDEPVRVDWIYGIFAVNKIKEYVDGFTPVTVDLIKIL